MEPEDAVVSVDLLVETVNLAVLTVEENPKSESSMKN